MLAPPSERRKILLVEDEAVLALAESSILKKEGYEVSVAHSGEDAIGRVGGDDFDLILMDIDLGSGMDGTQAAEEILKGREIPVVFLTSHTEPEVVAKTDRITSYGYVVKNSGATVLFASIKMAFRLHEARRTLQVRERRLAEALDEKGRIEKALEKRLLALTRPLESGVEELRFDELFDIAEVQKIQDAFSAATGVASIITEPDGTPITRPSGFCRLCASLVRRTPKGLANCMRSDAVLGAENKGQGPIVQRCLSAGLYDGGASISVGDKHIANWLVGQVLDDQEDWDSMLAYADEIGVDREAYRRALSEVTRMPRARFESISEALYLIAVQLSKHALQNVQQAQYITKLRDTMAPGDRGDRVEPAVAEPKTSLLGGKDAAAQTPADRSFSARGDSTGVVASAPEQSQPGVGGSEHGATGGRAADASGAVSEGDASADWRLLFRELQHRVKNSFSMIDALFGFQSTASDVPAQGALEALRWRVRSIGSIYNLLYDAPRDKRVRLDSYLGQIAGELGSSAGTTVELDLEPIEIQPNKAIPFGIVFNELLSNALKHARVDRSGPLAHVKLSGSAEGVLLEVADEGVGFDPIAGNVGDPSSMHGLSLARLLTEQLGGRMIVDSRPGEGASIRIVAPLA